jgi:hypothetical protein
MCVCDRRSAGGRKGAFSLMNSAAPFAGLSSARNIEPFLFSGH